MDDRQVDGPMNWPWSTWLQKELDPDRLTSI
jgi:hypothetical protein